MTRLTTDLERAVYERQRAASRDDRVLAVQFLRPDAPHSLTLRERQIAAEYERQSVAAVRAVRREMSDRHARQRTALGRLKEPQT